MFRPSVMGLLDSEEARKVSLSLDMVSKVGDRLALLLGNGPAGLPGDTQCQSVVG